jgi:hypothetical protein
MPVDQRSTASHAPTREAQPEKKKKKMPVSSSSAVDVSTLKGSRGPARDAGRAAGAREAGGDPIEAMGRRGINNPGDLLGRFADGEAILRTCDWYDELVAERRRRRLSPIGPGLLAKKIREGGVPAEPTSTGCPHTPELAEQWAPVIARLAVELGSRWGRVEQWIRALHPHAFDSDGWTLGAPQGVAGWLEKLHVLDVLDHAADAPVLLVECRGGKR